MFILKLDFSKLIFSFFFVLLVAAIILSALYWNIFLINLFILFIYFWLCWVFVAVCGLSLVVASGGYSSLRCAGFSLQWLLLLRSTGSRRMGFSSCGTWAQPEVTILHMGGGLSSCRRTQRYCYVYPFRRNWDPAPSLHCCFLTSPP